MAMGSTTVWMGATRGGSTRPLSSPWVMMMPPIRRVDTPQLVWKGWWSWLSAPVKVMSKALEKPSPKKWLVPAWRALRSCIMHSTQ